MTASGDVLLDPPYREVTGDIARNMRLSDGIVLPGGERVRPYAPFYNDEAGVTVLSYGERDNPDNIVPFSLGRLTGIYFNGDVVSELSGLRPVVSFEYYKPGDVDERVLVLRGFGFGVHPTHMKTGIHGDPEVPTWYMFGEHIGSRRPRGGPITLLHPTKQEVKHFSLARVVNGPLGDPRTDSGFRGRMNIPRRKQYI